jgi:ABC-2 type transport system permease protein
MTTQTLKWWLGLGWLSFKMRVAAQISYNRWSYISMFFAQMFSYFGMFVVIWVTMRAFQAVQGWSIYEVMILYALDLMAYACSQAFVIPLWRMDELVLRGGLDDYLIRPLPPLVHLIARNFNVGYLSHLTISLAALLFSYAQLSLSWGIAHWLLVFVTVVGGSMILAALTIIPASFAFWWGKESVSDLIRYGARQFTRYPITIYPAAIRAALTFIIPVAFVNYYPALSLLGKAPLYLWPLVTLVVGLALIMLSLVVWRAGLRRYSSSGT